jgi:NAD-dependent SIR2 family protein deacetylase
MLPCYRGDAEKFIEAYSTYLQQGMGAVFIGAGVSVAAGYPTWRGLVREMAEELELDLERERDLRPGSPMRLVQIWAGMR